MRLMVMYARGGSTPLQKERYGMHMNMKIKKLLIISMIIMSDKINQIGPVDVKTTGLSEKSQINVRINLVLTK